MARRPRCIAMAAGLVLLLVAMGASAFGGDPAGRPAAARSLELDQLGGTPQSSPSGPPKSVAPGSLSATSRSPDSLVAHSRSPGSDLGSGDAGGTLSSAAGPSSAASPDLSQLPVDSGEEQLPEQAPQLVPEPAAPGPHAAPALLGAWRNVRDAEKKLEGAQAAYTKMMIRNYPLGAARVRIEKARLAAIVAVNRARRRYADLAARVQ